MSDAKKIIRVSRIIEISLAVDSDSYGEYENGKPVIWPIEKAVEWERGKSLSDILNEFEWLDESDVRVISNTAWVEEVVDENGN